MSELFARVAATPGAIGASLDQFGGQIRCESCGIGWDMRPGLAGRYTGSGWPKCCGYTMRWWTQRQINDGEMPALPEGTP